jgi:hypothetical protein
VPEDHQLSLFDNPPEDADVRPPESIPLTPSRVKVPVSVSRNETA